VILGIYFTALQAFEYLEASFTIADSIYGSIFFIDYVTHGLSDPDSIYFFWQ
jgi:Heme/copper-type cytochrome/quinol oxidase, subunit 3